jgi:hypothetical protein
MKSTLKALIWLYIVLLIFEGSLRKWVLPGLAEPLLIVRDPVVLLIYAIAASKGWFPKNAFMVAIAGLIVASIILSFLAGQGNLVILGYGLRTNYLHFPLIWVMAKVLDRRDVEHIGLGLLLLAIPMTLLMVVQFRAAPDAWVNTGVGTAEGEVGQLYGADGKIRPPGFFAFVTGPQLFYPLVAAFLLAQLSATKRRLHWILLVGVGLSVVVALPVSISRTVMIATGVVGATYVLALPFATKGKTGIFRPLLILGVLAAALSQLPVFREGMDVFLIRWTEAASATGGDAVSDVIGRTIQTLVNPLYFAAEAPFFGHGIGMASNVANRLINGVQGINLAEEEWGKNLMELGPVLGFAFIGFRFALAFNLAAKAFRALRLDRDALPLLLLSACFVVVVQGQLGPPTMLGFVVLMPGLLLAALNPHVEDNEADAEAAVESRAVEPDRAVPRPNDRRPPIILR